MASTRVNRNNRPTTRKNLPPVEDLRPVGEDGSRPPLLDLHIRRKLKILLVANTLPFLAFAIFFFGWLMGSVSFRIDETRLLFTVLIMLCCLVVVGSCWWVLFPFSRWLRDYPLWYYHHESKAVWAIPMIMAWIIWLGMWVLCVGLTLFSLWLLGAGAWDLIGRL